MDVPFGLHAPVDLSKPLEEMTREERLRAEHQLMHEKHKNHETMHSEMVFIMFGTLLFTQIGLLLWKKHYYRSYSRASLVAMWLLPMMISVYYGFWRFLSVWSTFSLLTAIVIRRATSKPIEGSTPRLVYKWFYFVYKLSYALGIIGYLFILLALFGANFFREEPFYLTDAAVLCLYYGLYIGVLGRDIAELCTDQMASLIGYYTPQGIPTRHLEDDVCAVCANPLLFNDKDNVIIEKTFKLPCLHTFHEFCIRGWLIVGKKQTCPYCKEKVDLKLMFANPWEKPHLLYGHLLDWIRWLVGWQPLIFSLVQGINWTLGLE